MSNTELDSWLAEIGQGGDEASASLMARVLADAEQAQRGFVTSVPPAPNAARSAKGPGFLASLWATIGGGRGMAGLSAAALAGVWLGFSPPEAFSDTFDLSLLGASDLNALAADDFLAIDDFLVDG